MAPRVIPAHYDGETICLDEAVELTTSSRLLVTVLPDGVDQWHEEWGQFAAHALAYAYSDNEPDYSDAKLIWVNPDYAGR